MAVDVSPFIGKEGKKKTQQINAENQKKKKKKNKTKLNYFYHPLAGLSIV